MADRVQTTKPMSLAEWAAKYGKPGQIINVQGELRETSRYYIRAGSGFTTTYVYCARTLSMTSDLEDAIVLPLTDALRVSTRLRVQGLPVSVVNEHEALRERRWRRITFWTITALIFVAAVTATIQSMLAASASGLE